MQMHCIVTWTLSMALLGCSPTLNWRDVQVGDLHATLPCKPDQATRTVGIQSNTLPLDMWGCDVDGAMYTIARLAIPTEGQAAQIQGQWRQATLASIQATLDGVAAEPVQVSGAAWTEHRTAVGRDPQGGSVVGAFLWIVTDKVVYQLARYAPASDQESLDAWWQDLRLDVP